ncbi:MAG: tRNA lysidine(34) synthetase TilS [Flavobacteriales bacterium]|nr:tRNA lysidine(34) synthetase TilS [Flavobacteriales bacterium]
MQVELEEFIEAYKLFDRNDELILAVSGGADSVAMLHLLHDSGFRCSVAHCNFNLRGEESKGDQDFVSHLAQKLDLPFFTIDFNAQLYAEKSGMSIQEAARTLRYQWFGELHRARNALVLTAHHLDDHLETILINWSRGSGIRGSAGIPVQRLFLRRPMLGFTAAEIRNWCMENRIDFREDSSNTKDDYLRNHLRHHVIPAWKEKIPDLLSTSFRNSQLIRAQSENSEFHLNAFRSTHCVQDPFAFKIPIPEVLSFPHPSVLLYDLLNNYGFSPEVCAQMAGHLTDPNGARYISAHYEAYRDRGWILVYPHPINHTLTVRAPGSYSWNQFDLTIETIRMEGISLQQEPNSMIASSRSFQFPLHIRNWKEGDRMQPFGMAGHKLLSDIFTDLKIPVSVKRQIPIVCSDEQIIWIPTIKQAECTRVNAEDEFSWKFSFRFRP